MQLGDISSYEDAEALGISTSNIGVCKTIRRLAKLDRLRIDETEHRSGLNKHLFDYFDYCGVDILVFVKEYLSNLQPYMIERRKDQEKDKSFICVIDNQYRVSLYLKLDTKQFEEVVVSFHENNVRGVAKTNDLPIKYKKDSAYVAIFADSVLSKVSNDNRYVIRAFIQRGLKVLPLDLPAVKCKDVFIVAKRGIDAEFTEYCNDYVKDLYTSELALDFEQIEVFSALQQISFTSYGKDTFSTLSLLIDSLCIQTDYVSKSVADFALVTFTGNLRLTQEQRDELVDLLYEKYRVTSIKRIGVILNRITDALTVVQDEQFGIIDSFY